LIDSKVNPMNSRNENLAPMRGEQGFSAIEMLIAILLIMAVLGVVVKGMGDMQRRSFSESSKMDTVQETRDFIDQMVRDVHDVGYPPARVIGVLPGGAANNTPYCTDAFANGVLNAVVRNNVGIACGIVSFSPLSIIYEADLDGTGTVSAIYLNLVPGAGNTCPCTLQRGVITKAQELAGNVPQYFTTVNGVLNSGNGAGAATYPINLGGPGNYATYSAADVFAAFDANANPITVACTLATNPDCSQIRSLRITANVAPTYSDPTTKQYPVFSITSRARINF
jgi:type II secretory pathway pseudopilin PulG